MNNKIEVVKADITKVPVDAVVNAANSSLLGGGGVDGAIHKMGGKAILEACMQIRARQGGCNTGEAVITTAGNLPAKYVIHTVGPVWQGGNKDEEALLASAYHNSLFVAQANHCRSVAFPNISTGVYHFPKSLAAGIALREVQTFLQQYPQDFDKVIFVCFDEENYRLYHNLLTQNK
jgi:O-acetyl-ADP-ribose deacetylase (regulator of RNase III)